MFNDLESIASQEMMPGFHGKLIHTATMTLAYWDIDAGCDLPAHHHIHEQVVNMLEGKFELVVDGVKKELGPGMVAVIPSNAIHSGRSITKCRILDVFNPVREDYK